MRWARQQQSAQRWLQAVGALLVLVAALGLGGAVDLGEPPAPEPHGSMLAAVPATASVHAGAADAVSPSADGRVSATREASGGEAPRELRVHVTRAFCNRTPHYIGPVVVRAGGRVVLATVLKNQSPVVFEVPPDCERVTIEAPEHAPAVVPVPDPSARPRPLSAVLQPAARLRVAASYSGPLAEGAWELSLSTAHLDHGAVLAPTSDVPFVRGAAWHWQATLSLPTQRVVLSGEQPALASGEVRDLRLDFGGVATQRYRVVGPSADLLPHLVLQQSWDEGERRRGLELPLDASGVVQLVPLPGCRFRIGSVAMQPTVVGGETRLAPVRELVGVGLVDDGGAFLRSNAYDVAGNFLSSRQSVHALARDVVRLGLRLGGESKKAQPVDGSVLMQGVDLVRVQQVATVASVRGRLRIRTEGEPPAASVRKGLCIEVRPVGDAAVQKAVDDELEFELPGDSNCRIEWVGHSQRTLIAEACVVRPDATTELVARWPAFAVWTGEVQGYRELPKGRSWSYVAWGDGEWLGRGAARIEPEGGFERAFAAGEPLPASWRLTRGSLSVPAIVVRLDAGSRHLVLATAGDVRWVEIEPDMEPPWFVGCCVDGGPPFLRLFARHDGSDRIPVAAGQTVRGALQGRLDRRQSTLAWWAFGDGVDRLVVRPASGRWIELRPTAGRANRGAALVGPHGQWDLGYDLTTAAPLRVWVPDGTRSVVVFDGAEPRQTAQELPLGGADFVVID